MFRLPSHQLFVWNSMKMAPASIMYEWGRTEIWSVITAKINTWYYAIETCSFVIAFRHLGFGTCSFVIEFWYLAIGTCSFLMCFGFLLLNPAVLLLCYCICYFVLAFWHSAIGTLQTALLSFRFEILLLKTALLLLLCDILPLEHYDLHFCYCVLLLWWCSFHFGVLTR